MDSNTAPYLTESVPPRQQPAGRIAIPVHAVPRSSLAAALVFRIGVCYNMSMKIITGKVVAGRIVIEGEPLEEGSTVTVLA